MSIGLLITLLVAINLALSSIGVYIFIKKAKVGPISNIFIYVFRDGCSNLISKVNSKRI